MEDENKLEIDVHKINPIMSELMEEYILMRSGCRMETPIEEMTDLMKKLRVTVYSMMHRLDSIGGIRLG